MKRFNILSTLALLCLSSSAFALTINMKAVDPNDQGKDLGTITVSDAKCGVLITPNLHDLPPGTHGFHIHEKPSCQESAMAAGGHFDPKASEKHEGPYQHGHLGDLPILVVNDKGVADLPTLAPNLTMKELKGHAIMIHANGDNYSDTPEKLGGGGARIACGIIS